ncbi:cytochrome c oxidase subunit II [Synechococcus sp. CC9616]|jgi:cytochrome c oxidase subunit 2|uniref:cytochrome c oxidase subunit II n=1 Tax=Synechococcus sp. CC9616 TaxID=110663 RepID=UPI00048C953D|nr:cytochrome c oxidase subunit II [Synechococcus sp. CC9616]|tara:strand:- start:686 stop:1510 length:825 start_codon:yes stop_codon:yes gene_type:complete
MQIPSAIITLVIGMVLVLGGMWIGQNINLLPIDASVNAPIYDELFQVLFTIGTILFIGIIGLLVFSLVRFRRRPGQLGDGIAIEGNLPLEIFWTAVPAVVVLFVGLYSYDIYDRMGGMVPLAHDHSAGMAEQRIWGGISSGTVESGIVDALPIDVTAMQFAFLFHYPDGDITAGELHVPAGRPVTLRLEAKDVIHAFWVPEFRLKQDVIPGQPTQLSFTPTRPGRYPIVCAELCGPYHGGMRSTVVVDEPEAWDTWFSGNAKPDPTSETASTNT